jgi:hypothetical protein
MGTLLVIIILLVIFWNPIKHWLQKRMIRRMEKYMGGMGAQQDKNSSANRRNSDGSSRRRQQPREDAAHIMHEVAEDVEFVEVKEYSEETEITGEGRNRERRIYREEQISDAEYTIVKDDKKGGEK